ncbi:MAG: dihydroorotase family protein [Acidobacteriaceae bacterium]|nr:dihydroorotase family protein [Acidobacteriaceae bacterium]
MKYDLAVLNGTVVVPGVGPQRIDLGIQGGRIAALGHSIRAGEAEEVFDAQGLHVLPGAIDSHFHIGIYRPHGEDARSESLSAVAGGVTSLISYFRTGHNYLDKTGPYREIFPELLALSRGNFWCDYSYHIAPMTTDHIGEIEWLIDQGVCSFKFYMFYKGLNLASDSTQGKEYTMTENYDLGHLYELMYAIERANRGSKTRVSLSLHCENPELIRVFMLRVQREGGTGLKAYSNARPPLSEALSIEEAGVLANSTRCPINLLHLSSGEALRTAVDIRNRYRGADMALETTLHHLTLSYDVPEGLSGKVNPPLRSAEDQNALWDGVLRGQIDTVVSDHACCLRAMKAQELWPAWPGFGGTELLYPIMLSEGMWKRGLPLERVADLLAANPARLFGLYPLKGAIAVGSDADLAICDLESKRTVTAANLHSAQDHTPFEGLTLRGWPVATMLRGKIVWRDGAPLGNPAGMFLKRPLGRGAASNPG